MIVGFVGFIGAGKGAAGDIIEGFGFNKESFAKPVKDVAASMFGWDRQALEGDTQKSREWRERNDTYWTEKLGKEFSPRLALQLLGTEVGRQIFHPDFWIYSMEARIDEYHNYVITDVRFPNEIEWIRRQGGLVFEVARGERPEWFEVAKGANAGYVECIEQMKHVGVHYSEWAWIGCEIDGIIQNDGDLVDLAHEVTKALTKR